MSKKSTKTGMGLLLTLGVIFVVLKLRGLITWSWWWVLAPFWGQIAVIVFLILVVLIVAFIQQAIEEK